MATEEAAAVGAGEARALPEKVADVKEAMGAEEGKAEAKKTEVEGEREKAKKPRKPRSAGPQHPPYFEMIKEAILALDGKTGSSPYAIAKYMGEQHKEVLPANYRKVLAVRLRNFAAKGRLVKVKASFKLAEAEEKAAAAAAVAKAKRRRSAKKPSAPKEAKKAVAPARPARAKRAKKAAPAPAQPKQPRSIRTAVAAKKASA